MAFEEDKMRLEQYILQDNMKLARKRLSVKLKIDPKYLEYVDKDKHGYYFNVTDRKHKDYKSTKLQKVQMGSYT